MRGCSLFVALLVLVFGASLLVGRESVFNPFSLSSLDTLILYEIRLPRTLLAALVGATLGMAGAAMQGYLRNPLAEPGLLGVGNGAALGAVIAVYSGAAIGLPIFAMLGALLALWLAHVLVGRHTSSHALILAGIAVSSLGGAGVVLALNLSPNPFAAMDVMFWLMGSLENRTLAQVGQALPFMAVGWGLLLSCGKGLDALSLGETTAASLGVSLFSLRTRLMCGVALAVGASVAVAGSIGFVGLVVPHILRPVAGHRPARLLLLSALGGGVLLLLADMAVRFLPTSGMELRVGVMTSLIGAPFFLLLLRQMRRREWL